MKARALHHEWLPSRPQSSVAQHATHACALAHQPTLVHQNPGFISRFDASCLPVQIAGEIPDFDELAWVDARERKHVSRVVPLAIAASTEAIRDAGLEPSSMSMEEKREIGVILGTGGGAQEFSEEQYRLWHSGHVKQVSIFCIPSGTMGTIPSEISMRFGFRGYSHVVTAGCT